MVASRRTMVSRSPQTSRVGSVSWRTSPNRFHWPKPRATSVKAAGAIACASSTSCSKKWAFSGWVSSCTKDGISRASALPRSTRIRLHLLQQKVGIQRREDPFGRHAVDERECGRPVGKEQSELHGDGAAAGMRHQVEVIPVERGHDGPDVRGLLLDRIACLALLAAAGAAQVGRHRVEFPGQDGGETLPPAAAAEAAVQKEHGNPVGFAPPADAEPATRRRQI